MTEERTVTVRKLRAIMSGLTEEVSAEVFVTFCREHQQDIAHEKEIILLKHPEFQATVAETDITHAARMFVWWKNYKDKDGDWRRQSEPLTPKPLTPVHA